MPQARTAGTPTADKESASETPALPTSSSNGSYTRELIDLAVRFKEQKADLFKKIAANRRSLRDQIIMGIANEDEADWINEFYPVKTSAKKANKTA